MWLTHRRFILVSSFPFLPILAPIRDTCGNKLLSRLVDENLRDYIVADNAGKTAIRAGIRQDLIHRGLKFYIISESGAFKGECSDSKIDAKIAHALRDAPKKYCNLWFWKGIDIKDKLWKSFGKEGAKLEKGYILYSQKPEVENEIVEVNVDGGGDGDKNHFVSFKTMKMTKVTDAKWDFVVHRAADKETMKEMRKEISVTDSDGANDVSESGDTTSYDSSTNDGTTKSASECNQTHITTQCSNFAAHQVVELSLRHARGEEIEIIIMQRFMEAYTRNAMDPSSRPVLGEIRGTNPQRNLDQVLSQNQQDRSSHERAPGPSEERVVHSMTPSSNIQTSKTKKDVCNKVIWIWRENRTRMARHRPESIFGEPQDCWIRYEEEISCAIENSFQTQGGLGQYRMAEYEVDFGLMRQTSLRSGYQRQLKRVTPETEHMPTEAVPQSSSDLPSSQDSGDSEVVKVEADYELQVSPRAHHDVEKERQSKNDISTKVVWIWRENRTRMEKHKSQAIFGDPKHCWVRYDQEMSSVLESAYQAQDGKGQLSLSKYHVDFRLMRQTNLTTGYQRQIKRIVETMSGHSKLVDSDLAANQSDLMLLGVAEKMDKATIHTEEVGTTLDTDLSTINAFAANQNERQN